MAGDDRGLPIVRGEVSRALWVEPVDDAPHTGFGGLQNLVGQLELQLCLLGALTFVFRCRGDACGIGKRRLFVIDDLLQARRAGEIALLKLAKGRRQLRHLFPERLGLGWVGGGGGVDDAVQPALIRLADFDQEPYIEKKHTCLRAAG